MKKFSFFKEDLRKWFNPSHPEGGWKRINSKGEAIGPCAREPGEAKPKCMSNEKRASLSKKERASAVKAKRRHDPNPERKGKPINVSNFGKGKISEMKQLDEKNVPTSPEKWAQAKAQAKAKFDVYPSAYANGWAAKKYKAMGGGWKSVSEAKDDDAPFEGGHPAKKQAVPGKYGAGYSTARHLARMAAKRQMDKQKKPVKEETDTEEKNEMTLSQLHFMKYACEEIINYINDGGEVEEWYQVKVAKSFSEFESLHAFMEGEKRRLGMVKEDQIDEVSTELLGRYKKAAGAQASDADKAGNYAKANKRFSGIVKATKKQFANDAKKYQKEDTMSEQHREEGRFKPTVPQKVQNVSVGSPAVRKTNGARRADIVRSAAKKSAVVKDRFEPNPELSSNLTKNV